MNEQWAQTHETDIGIANAIAELAEGDTNVAERIWQEPTDEEVTEIWERATESGRLDAREMQWGIQTLWSFMGGDD